ncbi:MAG: MFS transporter, partial [Clostridia bacterium]|nr:MFS transporter [Clostridia bacterium]
PYLGELGSFFFFFYAVGQLINGAIGDKIKARYMISGGLLLAGIANVLFPLLSATPTVAKFAYAFSGFFLAMIYGPMTKVSAENTEPKHATRCSLGYTFAAFFGSPLAGILAVFLTWQNVFTVSSAVLFVMALIAFFSFLILEKTGIVKYGQYTQKKNGSTDFKKGLRMLFEQQIVRFALIAIITGIIRTSFVQWLTTYFSEFHHYSSEESSLIYTILTAVMSVTPFISVFFFERIFKFNMHRTILAMFSVSAVLFSVLHFVHLPIPNIVVLTLAIMASNASATMLWSRYCPSLRDTGMVSGATGFLDFLSYMAAAAANLIIPQIKYADGAINWNLLTWLCAALMVLGVLVMLPYGKIFRKKSDSAQNA